MKSVRFVCLFAFVLAATLPLLMEARSGSAVRASEVSRATAGGSPGLIFLPAVEYNSGGDATSVVVADLNGDGKPDLAVTNEPGTVGVLLGNGDGTFQTAVTYNTNNGASAEAIADVNGDGKLDLVVAGGNISVLLGNGDGTFRPATTFSAGSGSASFVAIADVNGDGKPDILTADECWTTCSIAGLSVLLGNGDGTFQTAAQYDSVGFGATSIAVADLNGDGRPDVVMTTECQNYRRNCNPPGEAVVFLGSGDGTFQPAVLYDTGGAYASSVTISDVNGDGHPDLVVSNQCQSVNSKTDCDSAGDVSILLNNGNGTFQSAVSYTSGGAFAGWAALADVNGDGKPDIVVSNECFGNCGSNTRAFGVLLGNGDGTFQSPFVFVWGSFGPFAIRDVNGDGNPDLIEANGSLHVLLNNNGAPPTTVSLASSLNPVNVNQTVAFTATVNSRSGGTLPGSVWFLDNDALIGTVPLTGNQAAYSTSYPAFKWAAGPHSITAAYGGVFGIANGSQSPVLTQYVRIAASKTELVSSGSPSLVGQSVTFTATVTSKDGGIPNGELVTFFSGPTVVGTGTTTNGVASLTTSFAQAKTYIIKAIYSGDDVFKPSTGKVKQIVESGATQSATAAETLFATAPKSESSGSTQHNYESRCPSKTKAFIEGGGPYVTESFTLEATANMDMYCHNVFHYICQGQMYFYLWNDGAWNELGAGTPVQQCAWEYQTSSLTAGTHRIKALYTADPNGFGPSSAITSVEVDEWPTTTTLSSTPNPSADKQDVAFTATAVPNQYAPTTPSGKIKFLNGTETLGAVVVNSNGVAAFTTKRLPVGTDSITAEYLGDADNASSVSAALSQVVNP